MRGINYTQTEVSSKSKFDHKAKVKVTPVIEIFIKTSSSLEKPEPQESFHQAMNAIAELNEDQLICHSIFLN